MYFAFQIKRKIEEVRQRPHAGGRGISTMYFPEQARAIMRQIPTAENQPPQEWETMRKRHKLGDEQIRTIWEWSRGMADSYDDMNFTPPSLSRISAPTLIVYGDRDFLYPVEMGVEIYRAIPRSALWVVPNGGHPWAYLLRRCRSVRLNGGYLL